MIVLIRGHIRNSFDNNKLYEFIKDLYEKNSDLEIYISTFSIVQNNISWRIIEIIDIPVTDEFIYNYFKDLSHLIKKIIIIDDTIIKLVGNVEGKINNGDAPLIGWKNYWYCKYEALNYINNSIENKNTYVVNLRFDLFSNSNNFNKNDSILFIENNKNKGLNKNLFIKEFHLRSFGIDNLYIGNIKTQYELASHFFYNLDDIILNNSIITNPELFVFIENEIIFS
jgi:hypothetical protein